jgi:ABC-type oligopeptide transport system substrate-binding subunit/tRNA A-37 threonylcarbamoyl transferase component Bud32/tetratricopeptide (TPR) repeat protein
MIGTILDERYRLDAELGRGAMAIVYRAHDVVLKRDVAVKVMSEAIALGTEGRARLLHEAQATASLNHPHIVSVHDAGEVGGSPFIVMELVEGKSLHEQRPESLDDIVAISRQVCAALEHAHSHDVVHRDLKPENVLLALDGTAKLTDFGLARSVASRMTSEGTIMGTVFYLAPELALGHSFDGRADLYALGVMLYELMTGRLPFAADDPVAIISQHLHAPVVPPRAKNPEIPPALDGLIVQLLSKDPEDRPASATEVLTALEQPSILDKEAVPAEELSVLERIERGRMVGREQEMQQARSLWNRALSHQGQMLLITGEAGIGKTRLVRELVTQAEVSGGQAFIGTSYEEGGMPYGPFRQIIRGVLRTPGDDRFDLAEFVVADLLTLVPELRPRYPDVPENPPLDPQAEQQRLFDNLMIFYSALSDRTPLLLILEDVQWADSGTLFLLRHLARHTRHQRMLIVATYREVEPDEAPRFHEVLLDLDRERLATRLNLPRLGREETGELLAILFAEEMTPEFLDGIYRETEGNPFFIEEVCKALVESGRVYYEDGRWHRPESIAELGIPQTVRVAIQSRVAKLPTDAQESLRLAAVLGREFDLDTLAQASELDQDTLLEALESAERAQLIEEVSADRGGTFAFVHRLIPTTLVEGLRILQRRRLHRQAADAIEMLHPDNFEALAYHYGGADNPDKATDYLLRAGDRARALYAHQEAIANYERALALLKEKGDHENAARTLMKLGLTYHSAFDFKRSRQVYEEGFILWQRVGQLDSAAFLAPAPHPLRTAVVEPSALDLYLGTDLPSLIAAEQLLSSLVQPTPGMGVVPDAVRSWEVSEGGHRYVFRLRDDVFWSDGVQVTAADFEYAWKRALERVRPSLFALWFYDFSGARAYHQGEAASSDEVGIDALDALTLAVELEGPTSYLFHLLAVMHPVPRHVVEVRGAGWTELSSIVTNGPFRLLAWERGQSMVLERNSDYHGRFGGNVERVECLFLVGQPQRLLQLYEDDELDILTLVSLPPAERDQARQRYAGDYVSGPWLSMSFIAFDTRRTPFDDRRVRRAFVLATDRGTLADVTLGGYASPARGGLVPPGMPGHSPGIGLPYDPEEAQRLLAEAGYPGGQGFPVIDCLARGEPGHDLLGEYLKSQWRHNLGVEITWQQIETSKFVDRMSEQQPHSWMVEWLVDYPDPDNVLRVNWFIPQWQNEVYEGLVNCAQRVTDQEERMRMYREADQILVEEAPVLPLYYGRFHLLVKPWVRKHPTSPQRLWFWKDVIIEPH